MVSQNNLGSPLNGKAESDIKQDTKDYLSLNVSIVGGGIAGLITATALRRLGHRVTVS